MCPIATCTFVTFPQVDTPIVIDNNLQLLAMIGVQVARCVMRGDVMMTMMTVMMMVVVCWC